ncbi:hypothetical protein V502_01878 [Pseudogymnoascus sp. VKM F-4520 (FW-2644)]|nr:hypothetical protein V502_01878 [Pseudogymnoascus sp. VKM F-4520 (FW-2644)]
MFNRRLESFSYDDTEQIAWKPGKGEWLIITCLSIITLIVAIDATILVPVLPIIAASLNGTATDAFWAGSSYLLACAVVQPFVVKLSDIFGRQILLLSSICFFTAGTIICCLSHNFTHFLIGRSIQGIGGGGCIPLTAVIITDIVPLRHRPTYLIFPSMSWAVASITGPLIGGLLAEHTTWRWVFYLNFPFCVIGIIMTLLVVKMDHRMSELPFIQKVALVDWFGGGLFIASMCSILIGITWGGCRYNWASVQILVPIIAGLIGMIATVVWESRVANPFLPLRLFNSCSGAASFSCAFIQGLLLFGMLYYLPFFFEACKNLTPTLAGITLIPITGAFVPTAIVIGIIITRTGSYRWALWSGFGFTIIAHGLLILLDAQTSSRRWIPIFLLCGFGHGLIVMTLIICIQAIAKPEDAANAAATYTFVRTIGMCVGVAIGGSIFQNALSNKLGDLALPTSVANNAVAFVAILKTLDFDSPIRQAYVIAYSHSFGQVFIAMTAIVGVVSFHKAISATTEPNTYSPKLYKRLGVDSFITSQRPIALAGVLSNIGPDGSKSSGAAAGIVISSPSTTNPDYLFTWTRDAALTLKCLVDFFSLSGDTALQQVIDNYVTAESQLQQVSNPSGTITSGGLGEPKFNIDMSAFTGPGGRPQRDGPALRATSLIAYSRLLISSGKSSYARSTVWPIIQNDLSYVSANWNKTTFDIWQEIESSSFFTVAVQYRALVEGNTLAVELGTSCTDCVSQAPQVLCFLQDFWSPTLGYTVANTGGGRSGKDVGTILASIHIFDTAAGCDATTFQPCSDRALANHKVVTDSFRSIYNINTGLGQGAAAAVGRYPEDVYFGGNPWYLATLAAAEQLYDALHVWAVQASITVTPISLAFFQDFDSSIAAGTYSSSDSTYVSLLDKVKAYADSYIAIVEKFTPSSRSFCEQFSKSDGVPVSAIDLTLSYTAFLTAVAAREGAMPASWGALSVSSVAQTCLKVE